MDTTECESEDRIDYRYNLTAVANEVLAAVFRKNGVASLVAIPTQSNIEIEWPVEGGPEEGEVLDYRLQWK